MGTGGSDPVLSAVLEHARSVGLLGPGSVEAQVDHARAMGDCHPEPPTRALDLGSGGGLPGLVLALRWPATRFTLLDSSLRSVRALAAALVRLDLTRRVEAIRVRAEEAARREDLREEFDLVTARSFGSPPVTAECAAGLVRPGGCLLVSEPPEEASAVVVGDPSGPERWPADGLAMLGFAPARRRGRGGFSFVVIEKRNPVEDRWPRRSGIPAKRPLWSAEIPRPGR